MRGLCLHRGGTAALARGTGACPSVRPYAVLVLGFLDQPVGRPAGSYYCFLRFKSEPPPTGRYSVENIFWLPQLTDSGLLVTIRLTDLRVSSSENLPSKPRDCAAVRTENRPSSESTEAGPFRTTFH